MTRKQKRLATIAGLALVVIGAISTPEKAPIAAARVKHSLPASIGGIPIRRAPVRFIAVARKEKRFLMEAMWTRFMPALHQAMAWIDEGAIGEVRMVQANFGFRYDAAPLFDPELGGGCRAPGHGVRRHRRRCLEHHGPQGLRDQVGFRVPRAIAGRDPAFLEAAPGPRHVSSRPAPSIQGCPP